MVSTINLLAYFSPEDPILISRWGFWTVFHEEMPSFLRWQSAMVSHDNLLADFFRCGHCCHLKILFWSVQMGFSWGDAIFPFALGDAVKSGLMGGGCRLKCCFSHLFGMTSTFYKDIKVWRITEWWRYCKALWDVKFSQIEWNGRKFCS